MALSSNATKTAPPPHPRLILASGVFAMAVFAISANLLPSVLASISKQYTHGLTQSGLLLAFAPAGFVLSTLIGGWLSERTGQRVFLLTGFGMLIMGLLLIALTRSYGGLQIGLFLIGVSGGFIESPATAVTANAFPERRAQVLNLTQIFYNIGAITGPALVAAILAFSEEWRVCFGVVAILAAAAFALCFMGMPTSEQHRKARKQAKPAPIHWPLVAVMGVAIFLYVGGEMTLARWGPNYLRQVFDASESRAAFAASGFWFGMMLGRAVYVLVVGRMGYLAPLLLSAILAGGTAIGIVFAPSALIAGIGCTVAGFFLGGTWATILGYATHENPGRTETVFGILVASGAMGLLLVPPLAGWIAESCGWSLRSVMAIGAGCILAEGILILGIWIRKSKVQPQPTIQQEMDR
jgi:fucose permease